MPSIGYYCNIWIAINAAVKFAVRKFYTRKFYVCKSYARKISNPECPQRPAITHPSQTASKDVTDRGFQWRDCLNNGMSPYCSNVYQPYIEY